MMPIVDIISSIGLLPSLSNNRVPSPSPTDGAGCATRPPGQRRPQHFGLAALRLVGFARVRAGSDHAVFPALKSWTRARSSFVMSGLGMSGLGGLAASGPR
jgi:hypothetical protein